MFPKPTAFIRISIFVIGAAIILGSTADIKAENTPKWTAIWTFDGILADTSGNDGHAYSSDAQFSTSPHGQALRLKSNTVIDIHDNPGIRLSRDFRFSCRVRLEKLPAGNAWATIFMKGGYSEGEYMLRVDPASEGSHFAFFVNTDKWEPRVRSKQSVKPGVWYQIEGGWNKEELWLRVNGETTRRSRKGKPTITSTPLHLGKFTGELDDLRISSPGGNRTVEACWPFEGSTQDASGHGHGFFEGERNYVPVPGGKAVQADGNLGIRSTPELQLAPGLRLDCSVLFKEIPEGITTIILKKDEYMLRLDPQSEGGRLSFFINVNGWEPRVSSVQRVKPDTWYHVKAGWDGLEMTLDVNGEQTTLSRAGIAKPGNGSLSLGRFNGLFDNVRIYNPKPDVIELRKLSTHSSLLRAGNTELLTGEVCNFGNTVTNCILKLELPKDVICETPTTLNLGTIQAGEQKKVEWRLEAEAATTATATFKLNTTGSKPKLSHKLLAFLPQKDPDPATRIWKPESRTMSAATYYVDGIAGDNTKAGTTPETAWKDFTPINGKTLGPGERLLIRRGSVINQELQLSAKGTAEAWAEIGAYGEGARPIIRRNWDIDDRCVLIKGADHLHIHDLIVSHAGKGIVVYYPKRGHKGLLIENCIAHHIEGLYRPNSHGIPEWRDRFGARGDGMDSSAGFAVCGAPAEDLVLRNCEMFQCSWGFRFSGDNVTVDRIFCHDNFAHNTSPHPALTSIRRSYLQNSIFDAPGWHAFAGTMGIMICDPISLVIRNCHFLNQPDSGSHDEGGIDFEARGNGCLIDRCTFRNNAGAAIEMLGLRSPQARNIEIVGSRFDRNNVATNLGPSEIFIWGKSSNPEVCCSTGVIRDNGYVLNPWVSFFTNQAPTMTSWTLTNNTQYATAEELDKAMPLNNPPVVDAGEEIWTDKTTIRMKGSVSDDRKPANQLTSTWELLEAPGVVKFRDQDKPETKAEFPTTGDYHLRLMADDGDLWRCDHTAVHILPDDTLVTRAWSFSTPLDKEGWTDWNLGTKDMDFREQKWACIARPVKIVAGGHYIVATENAADAHLLSPDDLDINLAKNNIITIRMQNHTSSTKMRIRFTTEDQPEWDENHGLFFAVKANDNVESLYTVDMRSVTGWKGKLKQLRLDFSDGTPVTGTCRIDYVWIGNVR